MESFGDHDTPIPPSLASLYGSMQSTSAEKPVSVIDETPDTCRICRSEASESQPLFYPCKCSGSIRYVHQECLMEWLSHSKKKYCELCKTPFHFTKLYDQSMPSSLPWPIFVRQLFLHLLTGLLRWIRYVLVAAVWSVALPWCIRQVWRGLFWLADGSWLPETQRRVHLLNDTAVAQHANSSLPGLSQEPGLDDAVDAQSMFRSFLSYLSGDSFGASALRILFSVPPVQLGPSSTERTWRKARTEMFQRPPSLLSDVRLIQSWTHSSLLKNMSIDVLEGILICLGLVASFILVFLIREWVINQQPMLNNPDIDAVDPAGPIAEDIRAQRAIRRARRRRPRVRDIPEPAAVLPGAALHEDPQPATDAPFRRRAMTDDHIGVPPSFDTLRPDIPVRAQSLSDAPSISAPSNDESNEVPVAEEMRPMPPAGAMMGNAIAVGSDPVDPSGSILGHGGNAAGFAASEAVLPQVEADEVARQGDVSDTTSNSDSIHQRETVHDSNIPIEMLQAPTTPSVRFRDNVSIIDNESLSSNTEETSMVATTHIMSIDSNQPTLPDREIISDETLTAAVDVAAENQVPPANEDSAPSAEDPSDAEAVEADLRRDPATFLGRIALWFWDVDGVPEPDLHQDLPHEQPQADQTHAEAPFVPEGNPAFAVLPGPGDNPQRAPDDMAAIPDFNDPNAIEDAEDLEGVLELMGMEGPLIGMVQNVVFSLLLISLTLAAAIWIPYIWGKIALILITNPLAFLVKAPIYLITHTVDLIADICFFVLGILGLAFNVLAKTVKNVSQPLLPAYSKMLDTERFEELAVNVTHQSGSRLEKTLIEAITIFSPDLPTFSMQSHRSLFAFKAGFAFVFTTLAETATNACTFIKETQWTFNTLAGGLAKIRSLIADPSVLTQYSRAGMKLVWSEGFRLLNPKLKPISLTDDMIPTEWSTQDKLIAIVLGYTFFTLAGLLCMRVAHRFIGLKPEEKVDGPIADRLREAGGVMKVIVIIGIEMIVFPLYCGLLLDVALLPLFEGASIQTRIAFIGHAPFTGLFLHWFAGTCYMFHFALFVSMCRKILRKGVLYFLRDPDDPTFHPVRDVLERPVPTQLGKIAFSAMVYGGLVIMCMGGVVWGVSCIDSVFPINWTTPEPRLAFPLDVGFFNVLLPFLIRSVKPSDKLSAVYEWWFRRVAHGLRLSHFLFGEEKEDEKWPRRFGLFPQRPSEGSQTQGSDKEGMYVRAPASDSCRIPKHQKAFLEVTENNERVDGQTDQSLGIHGRENQNFAKIWLPPHFRPRMATFVVFMWLFAASTGVACTVVPLIVGRKIIKVLSGTQRPVNDLYALTTGVYVLVTAGTLGAYAPAACVATVKKARQSLANTTDAIHQVLRGIRYIAGLAYLVVVFGFVLPFILSLITELYIHIPIFTFLFDREKFIASAPDTSDAQIMAAATTLTEAAAIGSPARKMPPTVYVLQTWTLGLLYLRLSLRIAMNFPCRHTRLASAIRSITRRGIWHPDIWLATRAVVLPFILLAIVLTIAPIGYARILIHIGRLTDADDIAHAYCFAYPGLLGLILAVYGVMLLKQRLASWKMTVRDEVYLVGERLHNYSRHMVESGDKGKGKARELSPEIDDDDVRMRPDVAADGNLLRDW